MATVEIDPREFAGRNAAVAADAFIATAGYWMDLPPTAWSEPTGCDRWDMHTLAGHIVGEAVWFANLVNGITKGEPALAGHAYEDLKVLEPGSMADRTTKAARTILASIEGASDEELAMPANLGWMQTPLWRATSTAATEAVLHNWDTRACREAPAALPVEWAVVLVPGIRDLAEALAHEDALDRHSETYLLQTGDGVGPLTIQALGGRVSILDGEHGHPDVVVELSADQLVRLLAGRLDLSQGEGAGITVVGDRDRAIALNEIFRGIAND